MRQIVACLFFFAANVQAQTTQSLVRVPATERLNSFYITNQAPLKPQHLIKLPVRAVVPGGWLRKSIELERDGLAGNLGEISIWLTKKNNAWLNKDGKGDWGWEELPYWLKGYANIGCFRIRK